MSVSLFLVLLWPMLRMMLVGVGLWLGWRTIPGHPRNAMILGGVLAFVGNLAVSSVMAVLADSPAAAAVGMLDVGEVCGGIVSVDQVAAATGEAVMWSRGTQSDDRCVGVFMTEDNRRLARVEVIRAPGGDDPSVRETLEFGEQLRLRDASVRAFRSPSGSVRLLRADGQNTVIVELPPESATLPLERAIAALHRG